MGKESQERGIAGENAVNKLAFSTYLKYWCYPNPKDEQGNKNEICDLLIIFKNVAILIAIKNYSFDGNYEKYFNATLEKAKNQLQGAERKLFNSARPVYIKHPDKKLEKFSADTINVIHRIVVNLNTAPLFYLGGIQNKQRKLIHVFNWEAFFKLVIELDTIPDFINYLNVRADCFANKTLLMLTGEENDYNSSVFTEFANYTSKFNPDEKTKILVSGTELDLLGDYLFHNKRFHENFYSTEYNGAVMHMDGNWQNYLARKEVQRKKKDDRLSYFVDEFVKREVLYKTDDTNLEIATELLSLSRFERRIVGKQFFEFWEKNKNEKGNFIARRYGILNDLVICFLLYDERMPHEHVMIALQVAMEGYSVWEHYKTKKMVMIAVSTKLQSFRFGYMKDIEPFPQEYEKNVITDLKTLGWFTNIENIVSNIKEYPEEIV